MPHSLRHRFPALLWVIAVLWATASIARAQEEVPFVTSPDNVTLEMLRMADVGPGDHVIDLGSGDGRIVILAAKRFGASGLGVEIVPHLVRESERNARDAGVAHRVSFKEQDLFQTDLSAATVVTMYLLPQVNLELRPALLALKPGTRLVSHDWDMAEWKPDRTVTVPVPDKKVGLDKSSKVHLWVVPAQVAGLWCGEGLLRDASLDLAQRYQEFEGTLRHRERSRPVAGRIEGNTLRAQGGKAGELVLAGSRRAIAHPCRGRAAGAGAGHGLSPRRRRALRLRVRPRRPAVRCTGTVYATKPCLHSRGRVAEENTFMTWSIIARDASGAFGVAVASRFFAVGALCPHARSGVGAVATQALVNPLYAAPALDGLAQGLAPAQVIERLTATDEGREHRQVHLIGADGKSAAHTGSCLRRLVRPHGGRGFLGRRQHAGRAAGHRGDGRGLPGQCRACRLPSA